MFRTTALLLTLSAFVGLSSAQAWAGELVDPTRPLGYGNNPVAAMVLELNSILVGGNRRLAVINGQQLRENDIIQGSGGIRLRRIEPQAVVLQQGDKIWHLRLAGSAVRRTAPTEN